MLIYNIIDDDYKPYCGNIKAREEDKLLYMLHMQGFSARELCVIFGLNNVHSVQVKYSRMNIKLNKPEKEEPENTDKEQEDAMYRDVSKKAV